MFYLFIIFKIVFSFRDSTTGKFNILHITLKKDLFIINFELKIKYNKAVKNNDSVILKVK